jgi:hypothetical protein
MRSILVSALVLVVLFLLLSCNESYDYSQASLGLGLKDYSCTEAWIEVQIGSNDKTANIYIKKNGEIIQTVNVGQSSTLYYFDSLLPNTNYTFDAVTYEDGKEVKSNPVTFKTLDTTSHNFTWQTFTFGQHSSSTLYDVAIINENNIWAVGEIYMNDTLGNSDPTPYNAVHWDGSSWEVKRIPTRTLSGTIVSSAIKTIFAFNGNDIWTFSIAGSYSHYISGNWVTEFVNERDGSGNKLWGTSSSNLYLVCTNGGISHYNGNTWTKIESGTNLDIYDILGAYNEKINEFEIYAVASKVLVNQEKKIIKINKTDNVTSLSTNGIPSNLTGIWFKNKVFYVVGSGMFRKNDIESSSEWKAFHYGLTNYHISDIRGNDYNDIIASGSFGELVHFNGINWKSFTDETYMNGAWGGTIKGNIICCVGLKDNRAIITIGKR